MDVLPNITMESKNIEDNKEDLKGEKDDEILEVEVDEPEPEPEPKLSQDDIFVKPPTMKKVKEPKKKRVLSDKHKEQLAQARIKALETRRKNAAMKKEMKDLEKLEKQQKLESLRNRTKPKKEVAEPTENSAEISESQEEYREPEPRILQKKPTQSPQLNLEEISLNAIMSYEKIRKARKKEKKEKLEVEAQQRHLRSQLQRAVSTPQTPVYSKNGAWDDFF